MKTYTVQEAVLKLYNNTRKAPLTVDEHDENRACVDVLAQVLGLTIQWSIPTDDKKEEVPVADGPKQNDILGLKSKPVKNVKLN
jgi:hypothetical protein